MKDLKNQDSASKSAEGIYQQNETKLDEYQEEEEKDEESLDKALNVNVNPFEEFDIRTNQDDQDVIDEINRYSEWKHIISYKHAHKMRVI